MTYEDVIQFREMITLIGIFTLNFFNIIIK
jgi:hypothetical protein